MHFLNIAESSLAEVSYCIHAARRLGYVSDALYAELEVELNRVGAPLVGLIRSERTTIAAEMIGLLLLAGLVVGLWL